MDLETVKKHIRVLDDFEDDILTEYLEWSKTKVESSVTSTPHLYITFFESNSHYKRAVILLTAHYFNNRLPLSDKPQYNLSFGLRDALSHLNANFLMYQKELNESDEIEEIDEDEFD
ncbi:head-tail connector protein [Corticicoccus populi]|uniref:Head-tail connector protein n=1 Tax=Corticicoccus populi TaxID=1812821 RepID=A0ABW5WQY9_9STAP